MEEIKAKNPISVELLRSLPTNCELTLTLDSPTECARIQRLIAYTNCSGVRTDGAKLKSFRRPRCGKLLFTIVAYDKG